MTKFHPKINFTLFFLLLISLWLASCQKKEPAFFTHPEYQLIKEFDHRKIVMLADFKHGQPLSFRSLIFLLDQWIEMLAADKSDQRNLTLVLEWDDEIIAKINGYLETGNLDDLVEYWLPYRSLEMLEFLSDLRQFHLKINLMNNELSESAKIHFEIIGGEVSNLFNDVRLLKQSKYEGVKYFVHDRDSLAANKIIQYLNAHPSQKALVFYGSPHLIKNFVLKNNMNTLEDKDSYGYYLAYYLKQKFEDDSVLAVNQVVLPPQNLLSSPFAEVKDKNIFVRSQYIPWKNLKPENYDAFIIRHEVFIPRHPLYLIFSRRVVESCLKKMKFLEPYLPGYQAKQYYDIALNALKFMTGKNFKTIKDWENWYKKNGFDGLARLDAEDFAEFVFTDYYENYKNPSTRRRLVMFGFGPGMMAVNNIPEKRYWKEVLWPQVLPRIKLLNSIGINWIGYAYEKEKAKKLIESITKKRFSREDEYLKFWRKYFCQASY
ncbi:hypothetical protein B6D60_08915 [candidate division KSB1 bacterium 4484_87]|nr:MAG: hypothetical protein B6D60_08915 [candidate division KSB1 bacterium 4484_87]